MPKNIKKQKKNNFDVSYLNRDFESFRNSLIRYAQTHYQENIRDFSESSLAGMFVDMAAYVGDVMSYYLDHQFNELNLETAIEEQNIIRLIRQSGVKNFSASPSISRCTFSIIVDAVTSPSGEPVPDPQMLPIIKAGTVCSSTAGIDFELLSDIDFSKKDADGNYLASQSVVSDSITSSGTATEFIMSVTQEVTSASTNSETFSFDDALVPFRTITLSKTNVSEIISIIDSDGDEYYEVNSLTQGTVYKREINDLDDRFSVPERIKLIPAPKRYVKFTDNETNLTTIRFGSGDEDVFDEDIVPDPSEHAIKLYGDRKTFNIAAIDPGSFLSTSTLGISPKSTVLTVRYRSGGGTSHNVAAGAINSVKTLLTKFGSGVSSIKIARLRESVTVININSASGGENKPTINDLKQLAFSSINLQDRIVTREDLIARIYSMPNNFGRVFRVGVRNNPYNPFSSNMHILGRNSSNKLSLCNDSLKENIKTYLEKYRLVSDAIDIVDGRILNIAIEYHVKIDSKFDPESTILDINNSIKNYLKIENMQIDQPIYISEILNIILNTPGVVYVEPKNGNTVTLLSKSGTDQISNLNYSSVLYNPGAYVSDGVYYPLQGGMFEIKYPDDDIRGYVI